MPKVKVDYDDVNVSHMEATNGSDDYGDDDDDDVSVQLTSYTSQLLLDLQPFMRLSFIDHGSKG
jgi:hypothetical protein